VKPGDLVNIDLRSSPGPLGTSVVGMIIERLNPEEDYYAVSVFGKIRKIHVGFLTPALPKYNGDCPDNEDCEE